MLARHSELVLQSKNSEMLVEIQIHSCRFPGGSRAVTMLRMPYRLDRRSFLIAGGLTALASTRVLGANDTVRVGVIGAGGRMGDLLHAAEKAGNYQIVAVSDVYAPHRDAVKLRSNGIATTHVHYHEVLEQQLDAVLIASPDHWHVRMAVDA